MRRLKRTLRRMVGALILRTSLRGYLRDALALAMEIQSAARRLQTLSNGQAADLAHHIEIAARWLSGTLDQAATQVRGSDGGQQLTLAFGR